MSFSMRYVSVEFIHSLCYFVLIMCQICVSYLYSRRKVNDFSLLRNPSQLQRYNFAFTHIANHTKLSVAMVALNCKCVWNMRVECQYFSLWMVNEINNIMSLEGYQWNRSYAPNQYVKLTPIEIKWIACSYKVNSPKTCTLCIGHWMLHLLADHINRLYYHLVPMNNCQIQVFLLLITINFRRIVW